MRFASAMFDSHKAVLSGIDDFGSLKDYLDSLDLGGRFLEYAADVDGIVPGKGEWEKTEEYLLPQLYALVGRYSKLDDEAFYRFYITIDETIKAALNAPDTVRLDGSDLENNPA